jgi:hypothetical protein
VKLVLTRIGSTPWGTLGRLIAESGFSCVTMERQWRNNAIKRSCIPAGVYPLKLRYSPVVYRTTKGRHDKGWEVLDVPNRSLIMFHPGNFEDDVNGCIAPGRAFSVLNRVPCVSHSLPTFNRMMDELAADPDHRLEIVWERPEENQ